MELLIFIEHLVLGAMNACALVAAAYVGARRWNGKRNDRSGTDTSSGYPTKEEK